MPSPNGPDAELPPEAIAALRQGLKLDAIKIVRAATGLGLRESKDRVDGYIRNHPDVGRAIDEVAAVAWQKTRPLLIGLGVLVLAAAIWFVLGQAAPASAP